MIIEFSFDDGHPQDRKIADLLKKYGFNATFYLTSKNLFKLKDLYVQLDKEGFWIGGHTVTHPMDMKVLSDEELCYEILQNKNDIENIIDKEIEVFCYPRGRYNDKIIGLLKTAGYYQARTTVVGATSYDFDDTFRVPTTVHIFQRPEYEGVPWLEYAKKKFIEASMETKDPYFHVWGHAYEIERDNLWGEFEELLRFVSERLLSTTDMVQKPQSSL